MHKSIKVSCIIILMIVFCLAGCTLLKTNSLKTNTYNTFKTLEVVYVQGMTLAADLYKQGRLSEEQKESIIVSGDNFRLSYEAAAEVFATYVMEPTVANESNLFNVIATMFETRSDFMRLINEYK